jgi:hypothetical protein
LVQVQSRWQHQDAQLVEQAAPQGKVFSRKGFPSSLLIRSPVFPYLVNAIMQTAGRTHEGYLWVNRVAGSIPAMLVKQRVAQWIEQVVFVPKGAKTSPSAKSLSAVCFIIRCSHDYGLWVERKRLL